MIARTGTSKGLPPTASASERELFRRLLDPGHMREVFQRELGRATREPIRVTGCKTKMRRTRAAVRNGRLEVVYRVRVEREEEGEREYVLFGSAPESAGFLRVEEARCRSLRGHPSIVPFSSPASHIKDLRLALRFFPLDPALPALADLTGRRGARLLAPHLPESRLGATVDGVRCELVRYKPCRRAVLRATVSFSGGRTNPRSVYAKVFADDRGARVHADLEGMWSATSCARFLRMPEPLGYDPVRRMLLTSEVPGERDLGDWIGHLEKGRTLPPGVDLGRVERALLVAAESLAELQRCRVRPTRTHTFRSALAALGNDLDALRGKLPATALRGAEAMLARLGRNAPAREALVPSHGCFRHKQMVGDETALYLVDWDGLCLADAAFDAATFLGRLRRGPLRDPGAAPELERLADAFRRRFLARRPEVSARALALQEGLVIVEDLLRSFRRPSDGERLEQENRSLAAAAATRLDLAEGRRP
ncbi:MAG: hypothetical protein L0323_17425 [Planctomycetes bacterium]|nr:hypothetical protein [Planctomycetota bacterium]